MADQDAYSGKGLVKEVQSGDCLTILVSGAGAKGPANELVLTLASLDAPRLSRRAGDAPFSQMSREFLRSRCAGKIVDFKVEYKVETIGRTFGTVFVDGEDVSLAIVEAGLAAVKEARGGDCSGAYDELLALETSAKAGGIGMWTTSKKKIEAASVKVRNAGDSDITDVELEAIFKQIEDKPVEAIIEYVRDGSNMRVQLVDYHVVVPFSLAGVSCPSFKGKGIKLADGSYDDSLAKPEKFAAAAKNFTERRLLSRRVNIRVCAGPRKVNIFFGKVEHPKGDISVELLKAGLGKVSDWTLKYTPNRMALRAAERAAKEGRVRVWKNYTPPEASELSAFEGVVVEINSGDTLSVEDASSGDVKRVTLSSIRTPFAGTRDGAKRPEPFSFEARDALRQLTIGKKVSVSIEYLRHSRDKDGNERTDVAPRQSGTILVLGSGGGGAGKGAGAGNNVALALVKRGLASVVRHRGEEPRSVAYDDLLEAEMVAEKSKIGLHGNHGKAAGAPNDVTRDASKAKHFMSFLTRPGERVHQGVVDYCFNGSRFKVHIPKENVIITVNLIGVATPRTARAARNGQDAEPSEPCAEEALKFVKRAAMNRNVTVEIEDTDERGAALATVFVNVDGRRTNLNMELLKRGYARVVRWSADKSKNRGKMYDAADAARDARLGMWENWTPKPRPGEDGEEDDTTAIVGTQRVHVSHIDDARNFYVTLDDEAIKASLAELQQVGPTLAPLDVNVKTKTIAAIDFNGEWCRVRVDRVNRKKAPAAAAAAPAEAGAEEAGESAEAGEKGEGDGEAAANGEEAAAPLPAPAGAVTVDISYADYGNKEAAVPLEELKALPEALAKLPATAMKAYLAFLKAPSLDKQGGQEAGELLNELTWEKELVAEVLPADDNGVPVILFDAAEADAAAAAKADDAAAAAATEAAGEEAATDKEEEEEEEEEEEAVAEPKAAAPLSVNAQLLQAGLARVVRPRQRRGFGGRPAPPAAAPKGPHAAIQKAFMVVEDAAHNAHVGIWRYGDPGDSDDDTGRN